MNIRCYVVACVLGCRLTAAGVAQDAPVAASPPFAERLREMAVRWVAPEELTAASRRELDSTLAAAEKGDVEAAMAPWRKFVTRQRESARPFNPEACVGYVLNRLAVARNRGAEEACRRLRYYDAQEAAILEHVSTVDKQLSANGADHVLGAALREPQLGAFGDGEEPVTLAPGRSEGAEELRATLARWRERLPGISRAREAAVDDFVRVVQEDVTLAAEIQDVELRLRGEMATAGAEGN